MSLRFGTVWLLVGLIAVSFACGDDDAALSGDAGVIFNAPNNPFPCLDPMPIGSDRPGVLQCANGMMIQSRPPECAPSATPASDECRRSSDCGARQPCYCGQPDVSGGNFCGAALTDGDCLSDLDCVSGFHCVSYSFGFSDWIMGRQRCQQPVDECAVGDDCPFSGEDAGYYYHPLCQDDAQGRLCCSPYDNWGCTPRS